MYQMSPRDFSKLNRAISNEIEKVLLKFVSDGKILVISDENHSKPAGNDEKRKRGRPPRNIKTDEKIKQKEKKPRGRPPKVRPDILPGPEDKKARGRPRKNNI